MNYDKKYKSIFISDIHLGSRGCKSDALCKFLKNNSCENLFLVGDIVDGWRLKKRWYFPQSHANVIRRFLTSAKRGTNVFYIVGNHDEGLRSFIRYGIDIGNIKVSNQYTYQAIDKKRYLVTHGDMFDNLMNQNNKWLMHFGDTLYDFLIWLNTHFNRARLLLGFSYWSLSKWLKKNAKQAVKFINRFEEYLALYCENKGFDGVICGHIHHAEIKRINNVIYMNSGDWVESLTALVENHDGTWKIVHEDNTNTD